MLWVILVCMNCSISDVREQGWRAGPALASNMGFDSDWRQADGRSFASRDECVAAIRQEHPATSWSKPDHFGQINMIEHDENAVGVIATIPMHMIRTDYTACFSVDPLVG